MSEAEEQAAKWRIVEEHKAAKQQLAAIEQTASEFAGRLRNILEILQRGSHDPNLDTHLSHYPSSEQIKQLLTDREDAKDRLSRAKGRLEALGLDLR
jgi:hypothetical protein